MSAPLYDFEVVVRLTVRSYDPETVREHVADVLDIGDEGSTRAASVMASTVTVEGIPRAVPPRRVSGPRVVLVDEDGVPL